MPQTQPVEIILGAKAVQDNLRRTRKISFPFAGGIAPGDPLRLVHTYDTRRIKIVVTLPLFHSSDNALTMTADKKVHVCIARTGASAETIMLFRPFIVTDGWTTRLEKFLVALHKLCSCPVKHRGQLLTPGVHKGKVAYTYAYRTPTNKVVRVVRAIPPHLAVQSTLNERLMLPP